MAPLTSIAASLFALAATVCAVNTISVQGQQFVDSVTNKRFYIIGVDYQPGGQGAYNPTNTADPLSNGTLCLRDAALMQNLGINTLRAYNVDPALNHDECASIFNSVGIYMILDVNSPLAGQSIDRSNPGSSYYAAYLEHTFRVVEAFKSYPNTLGFFAGNEIINDVNTGNANPPYIRAVQRDLKAYIKAHATRAIPVGYSAADVRVVLADTHAYLSCNNSANGDSNSESDFFGLNIYSWCGSGSSFETAGYDQIVDIFSNSTIPAFFSEFGCNVPYPRVFDEVQALYGPQMTMLSGGLVYEYSQETTNYGLVQTFDNGTAQLLSDYESLMGQYNKINITLLETSNGTATHLTAPACNANLITEAGFSTDFKIPDPPPGAEALISAGVTNAPTGSIVSVTQTSVQLAVYATNGGQLAGLAISTQSGANVPGSTHSVSTKAASSSGTSSGASASSTGKSSGSTATSASGGSATTAATSATSSAAAYRVDAGLVGNAMAAAVVGVAAFAL